MSLADEKTPAQKPPLFLLNFSYVCPELSWLNDHFSIKVAWKKRFPHRRRGSQSPGSAQAPIAPARTHARAGSVEQDTKKSIHHANFSRLTISHHRPEPVWVKTLVGFWYVTNRKRRQQQAFFLVYIIHTRSCGGSAPVTSIAINLATFRSAVSYGSPFNYVIKRTFYESSLWLSRACLGKLILLWF